MAQLPEWLHKGSPSRPETGQYPLVSIEEFWTLGLPKSAMPLEHGLTSMFIGTYHFLPTMEIEKKNWMGERIFTAWASYTNCSVEPIRLALVKYTQH